METFELSLLAVVIAVAVFDFTNGFHDAADMVATAIASRSMRPAMAIGIVTGFTFIAPFTIGLAVADTVGTFVDISAVSRLQGESVVIAVLIMLMLLVNAFVDFYQESKALSAIAVLKRKLELKALVRRDGQWQLIDAVQIVPGDIVKLKIGDIIPADVKLVAGGDFLQIDQSALTGESLPVNKKQGEDAFANTIVKQGEMIAVVTATVLDTCFGKTVGLVARAQLEARSHFKKMVIKVGDFLIALTLVMITVILLVGIQRNESLSELLVFSLVLTISAIPVAMPAVLTVTMAIGAIALASKEENRDPIEQPVFEMIGQRGLRERLERFSLSNYVPFDPVIKRTQAEVSNTESELIVTKGAPQVIIELCHNHSFDTQQAYEQVDNFASQGFRTLGVAFRNATEKSFTFVGLIPLFDPPREDSAAAIADSREKGVETKMITGDNLAVAKYIAGLLDIGSKIEDVRELKGESSEEYILLSRILSRAIVKTLRSDMPEQPARQGQRDHGDNHHRPVLVEQQAPGIPLEEHTAQYHQEIADGVDIGKLLHDLRHVGNRRGKTGQDHCRHQEQKSTEDSLLLGNRQR